MFVNTLSSQRKIEGKWIEVYHDSSADVFECLANVLHAHYIMKAPYIARVTDNDNHDGTHTIIVYYSTDCRNVFTIHFAK